MPFSTERWSTRKCIRLLAWGGILLTHLVLAQAAFARPLIILSDDTPSYVEVLQQLRQHSGLSLDHITSDQLQHSFTEAELARRKYVVAVGAKATDTALTLIKDATVIATFIPRRSYEELLSQHKSSTLIARGRISALYLDQPYIRQLRLARLISPNARILSTALSHQSEGELPLLQAAADKTGFQLLHDTLHDSENPIKQLQPLIEKSDLFLALPDQAIFNRTTAKWILYITLRQRVPLLGFSQKYVEAGATAGLFSTPAQIGRQTGELLKKLSTTNSRLPAPAYPSYFSVTTNTAAARTLRLTLPDASKIEARLQQEEQ